MAQLEPLIQTYPTYGYRRLWALLRFRHGRSHNRKAVYRALRLKRWLVHQRIATPRPRVQCRRSRATQSNHRWAMDVTHILCGQDGWGHLTAVIDCHDREIIGYEFALRGRAKEAERAIEFACLARFGTLRPVAPTPVLRSDNGLIFQIRRFRQACRDYRLAQEFITPYTPQQNGLIERFFRSLKEECVWKGLLLGLKPPWGIPPLRVIRIYCGMWRWFGPIRRGVSTSPMYPWPSALCMWLPLWIGLVATWWVEPSESSPKLVEILPGSHVDVRPPSTRWSH